MDPMQLNAISQAMVALAAAVVASVVLMAISIAALVAVLWWQGKPHIHVDASRVEHFHPLPDDEPENEDGDKAWQNN